MATVTCTTILAYIFEFQFHFINTYRDETSPSAVFQYNVILVLGCVLLLFQLKALFFFFVPKAAVSSGGMLSFLAILVVPGMAKAEKATKQAASFKADRMVSAAIAHHEGTLAGSSLRTSTKRNDINDPTASMEVNGFGAHGLILALLFNLVGVIEAKTGTRDINKLKGLLNPKRGLPYTGAMLILATTASAGIPGMVGFIGEFLSFQGSYAAFPLATLICVASTGLTSVYFIIIINRTLFGRLESDIYLPVVHFYERIPAIVLTVLIVILGIQPNMLISLISLN